MNNIFYYEIDKKINLWEKDKNKFNFENDKILLEGYFFISTSNKYIFKKKYFLFNKNYFIYKNNKKSNKIQGIIKNNWVKYSIQELNGNIFKYKVKVYKKNRYCLFYFLNKNYEKWLSLFNKNFINTNFHDKYEPVKIIGKGSFASIYLLNNKLTNEKFAVKAFGKNYLIKQKNGLKSLKNEINLMKKLNHKNIIKLYEIHETKNSVYIVIELLKGGNLSKYLNFTNVLKDCYNIMKGLLEALNYIHKNGIMHRDIKPENIVLKEKTLSIKKSYIKLIDFGLATKIKTKNYIYKKCGTPGFIAPEILNMNSDEEIKYDEKCDIFSAGIVLYIILKGKPPFFHLKRENILNLNKQCNINFDNFKGENKNVISLLKSMLEIDPKKRLSSEECLKHEFFNSFEKKINGKKHVSIKLDNINIIQDENSKAFNSLNFKDENNYKKNKTMKKNLENYSGKSEKTNFSIKNRDSIYKWFSNNKFKKNENQNIKTQSNTKIKNMKNRTGKHSKFKI